MKLQFTLNDRPISCEISPEASLLSVLRHLGCHSVRSGCDTTSCGICTVWVEGRPILSCGYPAARAAGCAVTTIEGVREAADRLLHFMAEEGADQCGFCSPGFLMTVLAMERELSNPTEEEIRRYLAGNLCRCTGYASQARMLQKYLAKGERHD